MLPFVWMLLSSLLAFGHFFMLIQTDWIVHGAKHQGLYAWCYLTECEPRVNSFAVFTLGLYVIAGGALWSSVLLALPYLLCTNYSRPIEVAGNIQLFSGLLVSNNLLKSKISS